MALSFRIAVVFLAFAATLAAQQPDSNVPPKPSGTPQNPAPPHGQPPPLPDDAKISERPSADGTEAEVRHDGKQPPPSAVARVVRRAAPNCLNSVLNTCWSNSAQEEQAEEKVRREIQQRQDCKEMLAKSQSAAKLDTSGEDPCSAEAITESAHDLEVGDTYFGEKSYAAAENRYRLALVANPANAPAMLHFAQMLDKLGRNAEAYEEYQNFLNTGLQGPDEKRAHAATERLRKYWSGATERR